MTLFWIILSIAGLMGQLYYFRDVRIGGTICVLTMIAVASLFITLLNS